MSDVLFNSVRALQPVLIHYLVSVFISMISETMGLHLDAASLTTLAAVLVLPFLLYMIKKDRLCRGETVCGRLTSGKSMGIFLFALVCNLGFTVLGNLLIQAVSVVFSMEISNTVQEGLFSSNVIMQLMGIGIVVPVMEEVLFRGLVYNRFKDYNKEWLSGILGAAVFAIYHGNLMQIIFAFPMALIITETYRRNKTLAAPILFHVTVNISSVLITYAGQMYR